MFKKVKKLLRGDLFIPVLIFFVFLGIYWLTLAPSVSPQGDAGELITVAYILGISHPPGYPLFTLIGHLFTFLPLWSVAWRLNLFSAVCHCLTLVFVYLILKKITKSWLVAFFSILTLGFSYTFWLYSLVTEVFPLNDLFLSILFYLAVVINDTKDLKKTGKLFLFFFFVLGLSFSNHHTIILISPALFYLIYRKFLRSFSSRGTKKIKFVMASVLFFILGFLPYIYFPIRSRMGVFPIEWRPILSLVDLFRFFTRADYGSLNPYIGSDPSQVTLGQKWSQLVNYGRFLWDDFQIYGLLLAGLGLIYGFFRNKRFLVTILIGFLTNIFFLSYASFPISEFSGTTLGVIERFYLLPNIFVSMAIGLGVWALFSLVKRLRIVVFLGMVIYIFILTRANYPLVDQSGNYLDLELGRNVMRGLPHGAIIFPRGDVGTFAAFYAHYVEGFRRDVELVTDNLITSKYLYIRSRRPDLDFSPNFLATTSGIVANNLNRVESFVLGYPGFDLPGYSASPSGLHFVFKNNQSLPSVAQWESDNQTLLSNYVMPNDQDLESRTTIGDKVIIWHYANMYIFLGDNCRSQNDFDCAMKFYLSARRLDPFDTITKYRIAYLYFLSGNCVDSEREFLDIFKSNPKNRALLTDLIRLYGECFKDEKKNQEYKSIFESYFNEVYSLKKL